MQLIDPSHSFYKPLWIRLLIVGSCSGWAIFEAVAGDPFFMIIMGALALYSGRVLLVMYKLPVDPETPEKSPSADTDVGNAKAGSSSTDTKG